MVGLELQFFIFVKCISSFFTWLVFIPCWDNQSCVSLKAMVTIFAMVLSDGPEVRRAPSSTYSMVGESITLHSFMRLLSSGDSFMHVFVFHWISPTIGEVKYAARISDTHVPWGTPVLIGRSLSLLPSKQIVAHQSLRKE